MLDKHSCSVKAIYFKVNVYHCDPVRFKSPYLDAVANASTTLVPFLLSAMLAYAFEKKKTVLNRNITYI